MKLLCFTMPAEQIQEPFKWTNTWNQYLSTIIVAIIMYSHGTVAAWPTTGLPVLQSNHTPLASGPLATAEISWIGSVNSIGGIIGTIAFGYIVSLIGSKRAIIFLTLPEITYWILIYFGNHYYYILVARVLSGFTGAGIVPLVLFVSEIANDDIRGRLASSTILTKNIGVLTSHLLGITVEYSTVPKICIIFPIVFLITFLMLPNTPQYHLKHGNTKKAVKSLKFYKGCRGKSEDENHAFFNEFERLKNNAIEQNSRGSIQLSDFWSKSALKGFAVCFTLTAFTQFTANHTIASYAVMIYKRTGTTIDTYVSLLLLSLALIFGSLLTTFLADIFGRKILNVGSLGGSALGLFIVSIYHYFFINGYDLSGIVWIPVISLSFVIFISSAGVISLAYVCSVEYLPLKIRTSGYAIVVIWSSIVSFIVTKLFPILMDIIDVHWCFLIFGVGSTLGAIFVAVVMEETSGKSLDDDVGLNKKIEARRGSTLKN